MAAFRSSSLLATALAMALAGCVAPRTHSAETEYDRLTRLAHEYAAQQQAQDLKVCAAQYERSSDAFRQCAEHHLARRQAELDYLIREIEQRLGSGATGCTNPVTRQPGRCLSA